MRLCCGEWSHMPTCSSCTQMQRPRSKLKLGGERQAAVVRPMNKSSRVRLQSSDGEVLLLIKA